MNQTFLQWLPCEDRGCYGIYDGGFEAKAEGKALDPYLKELEAKVDPLLVKSEVWEVDAGRWYFGQAALERIAEERSRKVPL